MWSTHYFGALARITFVTSLCLLIVIEIGLQSLPIVENEYLSQSSGRCDPPQVLTTRGVSQRNVLLDIGANWANTLRLWQDITNFSEPFHIWEVYGFEASPLIHPFLEDFVTWLNGLAAKPVVTVPPTGSSKHLRAYAHEFGCSDKTRYRECMWNKFRKQLAALRPRASLNSSALVQERLAVAASPALDKTRYTFVPAAAGATSGWLDLGMLSANSMIRGGAISSHYSDATGQWKDGQRIHSRTWTPVVDIVTWMIQYFREEDFVLVKIDAEGAEFDILNGLETRGKLGLIDMLVWECHEFAGDCAQLSEVVESSVKRILQEGRGYNGFDSCSTPENYKVQDPG